MRALLNFGHTFGHAIEAGTGYGTWLHGEAVAAGMVLAAQLSQRLGYLDRSRRRRASSRCSRARGLPVERARPRRRALSRADGPRQESRRRAAPVRPARSASARAFVSEAPRAALAGGPRAPGGACVSAARAPTPRCRERTPRPPPRRSRRRAAAASTSATATASSIPPRSGGSSTRRRSSSTTKAISSARGSRTASKSRRSGARSRAICGSTRT